jgi:GT2 family glycosyltransferase
MSAEHVEVLIVSFRTRDLLLDCLASLERSLPRRDDVRCTIAVLDNASGDGTVEAVARRHPDVRLVASEENLGFGGGNNALARTSTADYLLLLNPDTLVEEDVVTPLLEVLRARPEVLVAGPRQLDAQGRIGLASQRLPGLRYELARVLRGTKLRRLPGLDAERVVRAVEQRDLAEDRATRDTEFLWATCWLLRRREVPEDGIFDSRFPMYDEDLAFCAAARRAGRAVAYVPSASIVHLGGASSTSERKRAMMRRARTTYYRAFHGAPAAWVHGRVLPAIERRKRS